MKSNHIDINIARDSLFLVFVLVLGSFFLYNLAQAQTLDNPDPPSEPVKLIFIHHSTGENWLVDDYGGLGLGLAQNNYFVSDTNYGWGPDAIGDRTDIVNWTEWFRGPDSLRYLEALFEESGQNSTYTRLMADPGGENTVVVFKSCFPNSNLEGNPDDSATPGDGLTVSNAKYIYNDLLNYFSSRPDKLFIVVTAPPVQDPSYAANARAFNTWLVLNWLDENNYPYSNVAVFDFYNVLTHPENHHRFHNGQVEYSTSQENNTSYYPSAADDDHPSAEGSRKATNEFIPLLNVFYNRWKSDTSAQPPSSAPTSTSVIAIQVTPVETQPPASAIQPSNIPNLIDDFEAGIPAGSEGWRPYWDEATQTQLLCAPETNDQIPGSALHVNYTVQANSWATCALLYTQPQNWIDSDGLTFQMRTSQAGLLFDVIVYAGLPDNRSTYLTGLETTSEMVNGWVSIQIPWVEFIRADWEDDSGEFVDPSGVTGIAFGFNGGPDASEIGEVWVDDIRLGVESELAVAPAPTQAEVQETEVVQEQEGSEDETESGSGSRFTCPGFIGIAAFAVANLFWATNHRKRGR